MKIMARVLTPFHLLYGRNLNDRAVLRCTKIDLDSEAMGNRLKYLQIVVQNFWNKFYHEFTMSLRERHAYQSKKYGNKILQIGDVVIIKDDKIQPRGTWKKGRVENLIVGRDDVVRGAVLRV